MKLAVIGGDARLGYAAARLAKESGQVIYAHETREPPRGVLFSRDLPSVIASSNAVILPIPLTKDGKTVTDSPSLALSSVIPSLAPGAVILGGNLSAAFTSEARRQGIKTYDFLNIESFVLKNAYLTAQAALGILLNEMTVCLHGVELAVIGFGRIGKFLSRMLLSLGADVTVYARRDSDLAMAALIGLHTCPIEQLIADVRLLSPARAVINTAPARILTQDHIACLAPEAILLELASGSGNLPTPSASSGVRLILAGGLPGKCFPRSAGEILGDAALEVLGLYAPKKC